MKGFVLLAFLAPLLSCRSGPSAHEASRARQQQELKRYDEWAKLHPEEAKSNHFWVNP